ncbi:hypothetical protein E2C01_031097 [Portunus trituberculatus]|uniref:Uncharacterized protein n=1 Tax=Portunus trituberculatus TaxID=210409 RepID=A0A5B7EX73_PORTR|nr:hypothetical protein [Portunus trituberculatus]
MHSTVVTIGSISVEEGHTKRRTETPPFSYPMGLRCLRMSQINLATTMGHYSNHALSLSHRLRWVNFFFFF